jgi:hypothetical protein
VSGVSEILAELKARRVRFELRPRGGVRLFPVCLIDPSLLDRIRAHKTELIARIRADLAEAEIDRLAIADGWTPLPPVGDPASSVVSTNQRRGALHRMDTATGELKACNADGKTDELPPPSKSPTIEAYLNDLTTMMTSRWTLGPNSREKLPRR